MLELLLDALLGDFLRFADLLVVYCRVEDLCDCSAPCGLRGSTVSAPCRRPGAALRGRHRKFSVLFRRGLYLGSTQRSRRRSAGLSGGYLFDAGLNWLRFRLALVFEVLGVLEDFKLVRELGLFFKLLLSKIGPGIKLSFLI